MTHGWYHVICRQCFQDKRPGMDSLSSGDTSTQVCCYCGRETSDGIDYHDDPANTNCTKETKC